MACSPRRQSTQPPPTSPASHRLLRRRILTAGLLFADTAALAPPAVLVEAGGKIPSPGEASITRALAVTILSVFTPRIATLVMFATASLGRKTRARPPG